ncbi:thiaminase II [Hymenobacter sp. NST-14]|uniref:thiaminase II n=1 Tax=Hymenobacter piscis TaxID=2839984 RepID=UPI001C01CF5C|nr:thiaminase II [Hymenobacter piscis]MBT9394842.1 thiaminase II [Hymenobacter piscis]
MNWSTDAWAAAAPIYQQILQLPFIEELCAGTLDRGRFQFYLAQDSHYLAHFGRTLALLGARAPLLDDALAFVRFAEGAVVVENALHQSYFRTYGVTTTGQAEPACHHYLHFLRSTAALEAVETGMAAVLPCFWIYQEVGRHIYRTQHHPANPYQQWIDTYAGEEFGRLVTSAIAICDRAAAQATAAQRAAMTSAFVTASRLEWQFWEAAYRGRTWSGDTGGA